MIEVETKDRFGRTVGIVFVYGQNVNYELVRQEMAWVYKKYSKGKVLYELETQAKDEKRGLWVDKPHTTLGLA